LRKRVPLVVTLFFLLLFSSENNLVPIYDIKVTIMAKNKFININFPFKDSRKGHFIDLTSTDADAIKADLMHLVLTRKGERLYLPDFGTNLLKYIFQPNDGITHSEIKQEITTTVKKYLPNLQIDGVTVEQSDQNEHLATVTIEYTITDDVFQQSDFIVITI